MLSCLDKINGLVPFFEKRAIDPTILSWQELERLLNLRPFVNHKRFHILIWTIKNKPIISRTRPMLFSAGHAAGIKNNINDTTLTLFVLLIIKREIVYIITKMRSY